MNIPRGRSSKFQPFWNEKLSIQRKKIHANRIEAERTEGKSPEELRLAVIEWRRERTKVFLGMYEIIEEEQAGFRNGMSTSSSVMKFVHAIKSGFNSGNSSLAVFVDFQGAYDTICKERFLSKLRGQGIEGRMMSWTKRFQTQRWVKTN
ncbi:hypothetical protein NPIL_98471 [Nephila pilipes]|uniref:Reverse transcriptase domain-containing protein n=1 Tax=Nephila pilipes TaxID=299642 RepID=A0A8X6QVI3_NEPPI|nr:hypothetical protein NPIL_98471 [Nephila pilipes]